MNTLVCPNCNQPNEPYAQVCLRCGRALVNAYPAPMMAGGYAPPGYQPAPPPINYCRVCGMTYGPRAACPRCAVPTGTVANPNDATCTTYLHVGYPYPASSVNDSESVVNALDPNAGWNWGAAVFTVLWAIAHRVWWVIGAFVGILALPVLIIAGGSGESDFSSYISLGSAIFAGSYFILGLLLGMRGNALAWRRRRFDSVETFRAAQRKWRGAALVALSIAAAALIALSQLK